MIEQLTWFERHVARLLVVLYHGGRPVRSLLEGETRQFDSVWELQRFDFWVREPGHLALALLDTASADDVERRATVDRMLLDDGLDTHRVALPGASYNTLADFDASVSFLTARALVADRPSFTRGKNYAHQIVLESAGIAFTERLLAECPSFAWYRQQCETVAAYFTQLELIDLTLMPYLAPELTPIQASSARLAGVIRNRYERIFGNTEHVVV